MIDDDELGAALSARGFSPVFEVRILDVGPRMIPLVRATRELTGWGLGHAVAQLHTDAPLAVFADRHAATRAAESLREAGATVCVVLGECRRYGFRPDHPERGDQIIERLRVRGHAWGLDRGQLGRWPDEPLAEAPTLAQLLDPIDASLAAWAAAGLRAVADEWRVHAELAARDPDSERRLLDADADERRRELAVLGDWLQARGDPRGLLGALALDPEHDVEQLAGLTEAHASHLLGPARVWLPAVTLRWTGPVVDALTLDLDRAPEHDSAGLPELLATPACASLRSLALSRKQWTDLDLESLVVAPSAAGLRSLSLPRLTRVQGLGDRYPRLERLLARGGMVELGPAALPSLTALEVELDGLGAEGLTQTLVDLLADVHAPRLRDLSLRVHTGTGWAGGAGPFARELSTLLHAPACARLERLELTTSPNTPPAASGLAGCLAAVPAATCWRELDLRRLAMTAECRTELDRSQLPVRLA